MRKHGKKYMAAKAMVEPRTYEIGEAIELLKKTSVVKFDASCEVHMQMGLDPRQADQLIRGTVALPNGTGKTVRVVAFVPESMEKQAVAAGAMEAGAETLIDKIAKGWMDFDVAVAIPDMMKNMGKIAKILGQQGKMPNPKAGTISPDIVGLINDIKKGKVEFRLDKLANLHNVFGKASFDSAKLEENLKAFVRAIIAAKPSGAKGIYIKSITLASTMGPGIPLTESSTLAASA